MVVWKVVEDDMSWLVEVEVRAGGSRPWCNDQVVILAGWQAAECGDHVGVAVLMSSSGE